ncbi:hypothetical protein OL548_13725 [Lysinibacillus sp. MHQ-1]|nr:hypothetical protein OL548_13725 [Lysinibacillus sp. MHQ-1]
MIWFKFFSIGPFEKSMALYDIW